MRLENLVFCDGYNSSLECAVQTAEAAAKVAAGGGGDTIQMSYKDRFNDSNFTRNRHVNFSAKSSSELTPFLIKVWALPRRSKVKVGNRY